MNLRFGFMALLLVLLLAGCAASTHGPVSDSQLGRLRKVQLTAKALSNRIDGAFVCVKRYLRPPNTAFCFSLPAVPT